MAELWVTKPGDEGRLQGLEAEAAERQAELAQIQALSDMSACRLCGARTTLTQEHTPSKKAGNKGRMIHGTIDSAASLAAGSVRWKKNIVQGAKFASLCTSCNNDTGSWYNPAYVRFVRECQTAAVAKNAGQTCKVEVRAQRQRVAKQALTSLVATSQSGVTARYPDLKALILGKDERRAIAPIQLWLYLRVNRGANFTGITIAHDLERRRSRLVAGFSFWPLGWLMTFGDVPLEGAADVSSWTELDYHDKARVTVEVSCQWANTYPGDFRSPEEVAAEAAWHVRNPT